ncbi:MAG: hypothetical protein ACE5MG_04170 [Candidatus Methylomirabilales bacterium]
MRFSLRELVYIGIFGALWGGVEMSLGSVLHALGVPFTGTVLTGIGMTIVLTGRCIVPRPGSTFMIGVVTALLKMFSLGGVILRPMIGILAEALLAEVALTLARRVNALSLAVAGSLAVLWTLVHRLFIQLVFVGTGVLEVYWRIIERSAQTLGIDVRYVWLVLLVLVTIKVTIGAMAGLLAWGISPVVQRRMRGVHVAEMP